MRVFRIGGVLAVLTIAGWVSAPQARADSLVCFDGQENPQDGDAWQVICAGQQAYAEVQVVPNESGESVEIHVTDHQDCPPETHLECGFASSFDGDVQCLTESEPLQFDYAGYIPGVYVYCGCYAQDCLGE